MISNRPGLYYFENLTPEAQARAVETIIISDRRSLANDLREAKLAIKQNVNACVNKVKSHKDLTKLARKIKHLRAIEQDKKKAISYIQGNLAEFHQDGTYHTNILKHCEICHKKELQMADMFKKDTVVENVLPEGKGVIVCRVVGFIDAGDGTTMYRLVDARESDVRSDAWLIENNKTWAAPVENVRKHFSEDCDVCHKYGLVTFKG